MEIQRKSVKCKFPNGKRIWPFLVAHRPVLCNVCNLVNGPGVLGLGVVLRVHVLSHGRAADDVEGAVGDARGDVRSLEVELSVHKHFKEAFV